MTHNDSESLQKIRSRWQKEQQLIRKKYQISYNMTYTSKKCINKPISTASRDELSFKEEKNIVSYDDFKTNTFQLDKHHFNDPNIPPMYCSKCHLNLTECTCSDGLGKWWINLQKRTQSKDKISKTSSLNIDSSLTNLSSTKETNLQKIEPKQYVLLDWNNRQSLLNFIQTINPNKNLLNMTIEQLHEFIINNENIHIFTSIIDLILSIDKNQTFLCHIYIDPSYYSNTIPFSQSKLIADNVNLNQVIYSIQKIASLLGIKFDQNSSNEFLQETKQRKSILNQQSLFIASKVPYNTFYNTSIHTQ